MKKLFSILLAGFLFTGMMFGCGDAGSAEESRVSSPESSGKTDSASSEEDSDAPSKEAPAAAGDVDFSEHMAFTAWLQADPNDYYASYSDNPVVQYLNNKFNMTLSYEQPPSGSEQDAMSLMFGTGEYTDMVAINVYQGSVQALYEDGIIVDAGEYLDYMPNFKALIESDENVRRHVYNDDGRIFKLPVVATDEELVWGSLLYRHDILEEMTDGHVAFPSGNDVPTTYADWDYMLPLFKAYFEAAGLPQYACLILPYNGFFHYGEMATGFGFQTGDYYVNDKGEVGHGFLDDGLYDYLKKMNEWFEAGYIYQDFASRVNDMFFLPNTELTYGGAAGIWYGLAGQQGDALSMPEYGIDVDVRVMPSPIAEGIEPSQMLKRNPPPYEGSGAGVSVTTKCEDLPRFFATLDFMYSEEGGMLWKYGLTKEQLPESNGIYEANGLDEGAYWYDDKGDFVLNPLFDTMGGPIAPDNMAGIRLPGLSLNDNDRKIVSEATLHADEVWAQYDSVATNFKLPDSLSYNIEEDTLMADTITNVRDYTNRMIPNFIMGTEPLNEESFETFRTQLIRYGLADCVEIAQASYDRYMDR